MTELIDLVLHFDQLLPEIFAQYGTWIYAIVFLIVFCETGLVVTPFLPGDSMLFALGAFAAQGHVDIALLFAGLFFAAVAGDNTNYAIGRFFGRKLLENPRQKLFKREYYEKAHAFYQKHGGRAVVLARFVPIVRTFSPFVTGVAHMDYKKFLAYDVGGGAFWVGLFLGSGYALGNVPIVKNNFEIVVPVIIVVSVLPIVYEILAAKLSARKGARACGACDGVQSDR